MINRRAVLGSLAAMPLAATARGQAAATSPLIQRRLPGADEMIPIIGVGTARRYERLDESQLPAQRDTLQRFVDLGGRMIDTAPSYGEAETVIGQLVAELGIRPRIFLATKVGVNTKAEGVAEIEASFRKLRTDRIDLISVHNLRDINNQLATLRELKAAGRIRAIGATTSFDRQYADFEAMMRRERPEVIQVDYALDNRNAAERILPAAQELGMGVMINLPFGRGRLFEATRGRPLPDWAAEIDCTSWAQVFLKYIVSHPSVTVAIPGMAQARYVDDNMNAARGRLPDAALRRRMETFIDGL